MISVRLTFLSLRSCRERSKMAVTIIEFKNWLDGCIRDAKKNGLSDEDIIFALSEKLHKECTELVVKKCSRK